MTDHEVFGSWKEIADYLGKRIRTCWRWEKELGLPVHRIDSQSSRSRVFAYKSEVDQWLRDRANGGNHKPQPLSARKKTVLGLAGAAAVGLVLLALWLLFWRSPASSHPARLTSIAVLPFSDAAGPAHEAYFAEGINQEIIKGLRSYEGITVIVIPPVLEDKTMLGRLGQMGRELGLDFILKGYLNRERGGVSLMVQFLRAKDESLIWDSRYLDPLKNLAVVKEDIEAKVCGTLKIRSRHPSSSSLASLTANGGPSLEDYLKGSFVLSRLAGTSKDPWLLYHQGKFYERQSTGADNDLAQSLFQQALSVDPDYAQAYIGLANCFINNVAFNWDFNVQWLTKAEDLMNKAQVLSPGLPEYYSALMVSFLLREFYFNESKEASIQALAAEGLKRYPNDQQLNSALGIYYYRKYGRDGRPSDLKTALEYELRGFWLNPYAYGNIVYAEMLLLERNFDSAIEVCRLAEKLDSSLSVRFFLGEVYYYRGDLDQSRSLFLTFEALPRLKLFASYYLAMIQARRGDASGTRKILQEINLISPGEFRMFPDQLKLASAYLGLGDTEHGFAYLTQFFEAQKAANDRFINYRYVDLDGNFDKYRKDKRFLEILGRKVVPHG